MICMKKKLTIPIMAVLAIILIIYLVIFGSKNNPVKIIKTSFPQGDYVQDSRSADEACSDEIKGIEEANVGYKCKLTYSKKVDSPKQFDECIDGASVAGCYVCTFECR